MHWPFEDPPPPTVGTEEERLHIFRTVRDQMKARFESELQSGVFAPAVSTKEEKVMKTIEIFDPPMCCSTGVCGPSVDPVLPRFVADLHWLANQGVSVMRHNLAQEPQAFAANDAVRAALTSKGNDCLPLILVDGQIANESTYPDRKRLAELAGLDAAKVQAAIVLPVIENAS